MSVSSSMDGMRLRGTGRNEDNNKFCLKRKPNMFAVKQVSVLSHVLNSEDRKDYTVRVLCINDASKKSKI
jgi:hypothetical protein